MSRSRVLERGITRMPLELIIRTTILDTFLRCFVRLLPQSTSVHFGRKPHSRLELYSRIFVLYLKRCRECTTKVAESLDECWGVVRASPAPRGGIFFAHQTPV